MYNKEYMMTFVSNNSTANDIYLIPRDDAGADKQSGAVNIDDNRLSQGLEAC